MPTAAPTAPPKMPAATLARPSEPSPKSSFDPHIDARIGARRDASFDSRIDSYIQQARPFAQPILRHLRSLVHQACPHVHETIKWSRPFFEYKGCILGNMSAFTQHCSFGFWGEEIGAVLRQANVLQEGGMGSLGRITRIEDLPPKKQLLDLLRQAGGFIDRGEYTSPISARQQKKRPSAETALPGLAAAAPNPAHRVVKAKPALESPEDLLAALNTNPQAAAAFAAFSPSCKREYIEWIVDAKRAETRAKRLTQAIEWMAQGKQRHWKYQP